MDQSDPPKSLVENMQSDVGDICGINAKNTLHLDSFGPRREKTCLRRFANNKGADQPAHPRSLISAFVIHCLKSTI